LERGLPKVTECGKGAVPLPQSFSSSVETL
jgi:hypothetical protein